MNIFLSIKNKRYKVLMVHHDNTVCVPLDKKHNECSNLVVFNKQKIKDLFFARQLTITRQHI